MILKLCVNPIFQNKGIAKSTLLHIEKAVNSKGDSCYSIRCIL